MNKTFETLGYNQIIENLMTKANTLQAKEKLAELRPYLGETEVRKNLRETTQAKILLEELGTPPIPLMIQVDHYVDKAVKGELLLPEEIEQVGVFLTAVKRMKYYMEKGIALGNSLAYYDENLIYHGELFQEIERSIRGGRIDDFASNTLKYIRRQLQNLEEKIKTKAEGVLRANKAYAADSFIVTRNGRICIPIKKEYKRKVGGTVVEQSSTGATLFIEPQIVADLKSEFDLYKIDEDTEERRILYTLMNMIADHESDLLENIRVVVKLDFIFAKGKMSLEMNAIQPEINLDRFISLEAARHPLLPEKECVPLNFEIGNGTRGIIITGPNTGGKTVAIKTVALLSMMACAGLHIPCNSGNIALNSQVLCDIGDGQNLADNLSTFSAHISNVMGILKRVNEESLVVLDELGSGTDPAEGMGIAIAILEQLRMSNCLFIVTTHYPEVKEYAKRHPELLNARMAFDRESLKPLYRLEIGKAGNSCAIYIAKQLGFPNQMLKMAAEEAYGNGAVGVIEELALDQADDGIKKEKGPRIKTAVIKSEAKNGTVYQRGDSVMIFPDQKIGIVVAPADKQGNVLVQVQKEKLMLNHKRLKLKVTAQELYPEDYDFSVIFDSVEVRKKRHDMGRKFVKDDMLVLEEG